MEISSFFSQFASLGEKFSSLKLEFNKVLTLFKNNFSCKTMNIRPRFTWPGLVLCSDSTFVF